jgi:hypothetical protein
VINVDNHKTADALVNEIKDRLSLIDKSDGPVVNIILRGTLGFDRSNLNIDSIKELIKDQLNALYVDIRFDLMNDEFYISKLDSNELDRTGIEREVFRKLAQSDSMLASNSDLFAASISEVKDLAVKGADERTLDVVLRNIYEQIRMGTQPAQAATRAKPVKAETETDVTPAAKKTRKKAPAKGQAALDLGDGL